jgi:hypothetical protein
MATFRQRLNRGGPPVEASLIAMCCVCGLVRARKTFAGDPDRWVTKRAYEQMYGIRLVGGEPRDPHLLFWMSYGFHATGKAQWPDPFPLANRA